MEVRKIEPAYYAVDQGTGVALIRGEDRPPRDVLVDFGRGDGSIRPGAVVPVAWQQIWEYRGGQVDIPSLFRWPEFRKWLAQWPAELEEFHTRWELCFGAPEDALADAAAVIWEIPRL